MIAGWKVKEIERYLKGKYPKKILPSYDSLRKHKTNHVDEIIDKSVESNKHLQKAVRTKIRATITSADQLVASLNMVSISLKTYWGEFSNNTDPGKYRVLTNLINSANKTADLLLKYQEEINKNAVSEDEVYARLVWSLAGLPPETFNRIKDRWDTYDDQLR